MFSEISVPVWVLMIAIAAHVMTAVAQLAQAGLLRSHCRRAALIRDALARRLATIRAEQEEHPV